MPGELASEGAWALQQALELMTQALDILDGGGAPPQVAVHLEMAISEVRKLLSGE